MRLNVIIGSGQSFRSIANELRSILFNHLRFETFGPENVFVLAERKGVGPRFIRGVFARDMTGTFLCNDECGDRLNFLDLEKALLGWSDRKIDEHFALTIVGGDEDVLTGRNL